MFTKKLILYTLLYSLAIATSCYALCPFKDTFDLVGVDKLVMYDHLIIPSRSTDNKDPISVTLYNPSRISRLYYYPSFIISESEEMCEQDPNIDGTIGTKDFPYILSIPNYAVKRISYTVRVKIGYDANNYCTLDILDNAWNTAKIRNSSCVGNLTFVGLNKQGNSYGENEFYVNFKQS